LGIGRKRKGREGYEWIGRDGRIRRQEGG